MIAALSITTTASALALFYIYPPSLVRFSTGKSYSTWAADWWKWTLSQTPDQSPMLDLTGAKCAVGQTGNTWFLAGYDPNLTPVASVTRSCTIPFGRTLVFPIMNAGYGVFPQDPADQQGETFARSMVEWAADVNDLFLSIDGKSVSNAELKTYFERSDAFDFKLGANNIFTPTYHVGEQELKPFVDAGYYVALPSLLPGKHVVKFGGAGISTTYNLTIK